jgi:hypothetical protein
MTLTTPPLPQGLLLREIQQEPKADGTAAVTLRTDQGLIRGRYHPSADGDAAVLWVFGAGGGLGGPAGGVYDRLGRQLASEGIASLELDYRRPADLAPCVLDVQLGIQFLGRHGKTRVALVGHSFGGAVVITAGVQAASVIGVAAMSSQLYGTDWVDRLSPRPLLLIHGTADEVLPEWYSRDLYDRAQEPKQLRLYPGCRHGLDQYREALDQDLRDWIRAVVGPPQ